jgi:hypothetical protein
MVFDVPVLLIPSTLISNTCWAISLPLSRHAHPGKMMNSEFDSQGCLPVTTSFVALESKIPMGHPIYPTHRTTGSILSRHAGSLFGGVVFYPVHQQVHSWHFLVPITAHSFTDSRGLRTKWGLFHHVPIEHDIVLPTPCRKLIHKCRHEPLAHVIVVLIPTNAWFPIWKVP